MEGPKVTASMLYDFVRCPHRVALDHYEDPDLRDRVSPFVQLLWDRGHAFEEEVISQLQIPFVNLRTVPKPDRDLFTLQAIEAEEDLIYGGRIAADDLVGEPDLMRRQGQGYVAGDIKSGAGLEGQSEDTDGKPKKHYAVQLALYTDILRRKGILGSGPPFVWDIHGQEVPYELDSPRGPRTPVSMWEEYESALEGVRSIAEGRLETLPAHGAECKLCYWVTVCTCQLKEGDDLTLIPELGRARRAKLLDHVDSVTALADLDVSTLMRGKRTLIPGIGAEVLQRFQARARLQKRPGAKPYIREEITLPPDTVELFFDVETDPMRDICYLHGFVERSGGDVASESYVHFFTEKPTKEAEETAFAQAWTYVQTLKPTAIYFYSPYERTVWRQLGALYPGVATEEDVLGLFEAEAAVDLYHDVIRSKMEWPTRDLSIKTLATFLGFSWRDPEPSGTASVEWYHRWVETGEPDVRRRILEYNEDDCLAMRLLADHIRGLQDAG